MKFESTHTFSASLDATEAVLLDPDFYANLELPDVLHPTIELHEVRGPLHRLDTGWTYTGELNSLARRVVGSSQIRWTQAFRYDESTHTGTLLITPHLPVGRVSCKAQVTLTTKGGTTQRALAGDLKIGIPLVGAKAEQALVPGVLSRLRSEATAIDHELSARG